MIDNKKCISSWKSKRLSDGTAKRPAASDILSLLIDYFGAKIRLKFNGSILRKPKVSYTHQKVVNIYLVYELSASSLFDDDPTLKTSSLGTVRLTKNADIDKYQYLGYGIGFDRKPSFSSPGGGIGQNELIFGADMSSSVHVITGEKTY